VNTFKHYSGFKIKTFYISTIQHFAFAVQTKNPRKEAFEKVEKFFKKKNFKKCKMKSQGVGYITLHPT
jgi:hypothetical protein